MDLNFLKSHAGHIFSRFVFASSPVTIYSTFYVYIGEISVYTWLEVVDEITMMILVLFSRFTADLSKAR